jgi:hypothetical protein
MDYIILSAERSELSWQENNLRTHLLHTTLELHNVPYTEIEGVFEGIKEVSFVIPGKYKDLALKEIDYFGQHSFLALYNQKNSIQLAYLYVRETNQEVYLGPMNASASKPAYKDFSYNHETNRYYFI